MVHNDVTNRIASQSIVTIKDVRVAPTESHITNDDIVRVNQCALARDTNAVAGCRVAVNGDIRRLDINWFLQMNNSRNIKDYDARSGGFTTLTKSSRPAVSKARD